MISFLTIGPAWTRPCRSACLLLLCTLLMAGCGGGEEDVAVAPEAEAEAVAPGQDPARENLEAGRAFLAENRQRDGVTETESGLQYEVVEEGDGASPDANDVVQVHYEGTRLDGSVFDSSYERGQPATFPLNQVIPGWTEGVQLMQEGATYMFYIPADLAYGERGAGGTIGPNEVLTFKVELLEVQPQP